MFTRPKIHYTHVHINFNLAARTISAYGCVFVGICSALFRKTSNDECFCCFFFSLISLLLAPALSFSVYLVVTNSQRFLFCYYAIHSRDMCVFFFLFSFHFRLVHHHFFFSFSSLFSLHSCHAADLQIIFSCWFHFSWFIWMRRTLAKLKELLMFGCMTWTTYLKCVLGSKVKMKWNGITWNAIWCEPSLFLK